MTLPAGEILDLDSLCQTVVAAIVAGVGITVTFSLAVLGWARGADTARAGRRTIATPWMIVGSIGLVGSVAGIVLGLTVMAEK